MLSIFATSALAYQSVDVSSKFYSYASGYCSGGVHNADIGNGNLVNGFKELGVAEMDQRAYKMGRMHQAMSKEELIDMGFQPGSTEEPTEATRRLGGCDEQWGNTCQNSGGLYHWCNYSNLKCMSKYAGQNGAVTYSHMNKSPAVPETYELYYDNDYDQATSSTISKTQTTSNVQTISTTVSMEIGETLTIKAGVPDIMDVSDSFSWKFDMSTTSTDSKTTTDSFTWTGTIPEDAMSTTMVQFTVTKNSYSGAWAADIDLPYYAKIWCGSHTNGHYEWFIPAGGFMGAAPYQGKGVFTGGSGVSMHTTVRKCKLFAKTPEECDEDTIQTFEGELSHPETPRIQIE